MSVTKTIAAVVISGGIILGSMVYWNGSETIDSAISKITEQANAMEVFKSNENKLVSKIAVLKQLKATLEAKLAEKDLDAEEIIRLTSELEIANSQLLELEDSQHSAAERIGALEEQLKAANDDAARLQLTLDENSTTVQPLTESELNEILSSDTEVVPEPEAPEVPKNPSYKIGDSASYPVAGFKFTTEGASLRVTNESGKDATLSGIPGDAEKVLYNGNYRLFNTTSLKVITIEIAGNVIEVDISK